MDIDSLISGRSTGLVNSGFDPDAAIADRAPAPPPPIAAAPTAPPPSSPVDLNSLRGAVAGAAQHYGIDPNVLAGMLMKESALKPDVISGKQLSPAGAIGVMQFMPDTAKKYGIDPTDPVQSIFGAAAYLKDNLERFHGDYAKAVAGYNWGENRDAFNAPDWQSKLPAETKDYVDFVQQFARAMGSKDSPKAPVEGVDFNPGRGSVNPPLADPTSNAGATAPTVRTPTPPLATDPATFDENGLPTNDSAQQALNAPPPAAGPGRGNVFPPMNPPSPQEQAADATRRNNFNAIKRETYEQTADRLLRNAGGAAMSRVQQVLGAVNTIGPGGIAALVDATHGLISGKTETGAQDYVFGATDAFKTAQEYFAPSEKDAPTVVDKIVNSLATSAPDLGIAVATGGTSEAIPATEGVIKAATQQIAHGMKSMSVPAFVSGIGKTMDLVRNGTPLWEAINAGMMTATTTDMTGGLPMAAGGGVVSRGVQGAVAGTVSGEVSREAVNSVESPQNQTPFNPVEALTTAGTGALFGVTAGHGQARGDGANADFGYGGGVTNDQAATQRAPAVDPIHDVLSSSSVDDAITAASEAIKAPPTAARDSVAAKMQALRPLPPEYAPDGAMQQALRNAGLADKELNDSIASVTDGVAAGGGEPASAEPVAGVAGARPEPASTGNGVDAAATEPIADRGAAVPVGDGTVGAADAVTPAPVTAIWKSADTDYPVTVDQGSHTAPDGRTYQAVTFNGQKTFVPADELVNRSDAPPTPREPVAAVDTSPKPVDEAPKAEQVAPPAPEPEPAPVAEQAAAAPTERERIEAMRAPPKPSLAERVEAMRAKPAPEAEREQATLFSRTQGIPADAPHITSARDTDALKSHPDYAAAKAGDPEAAARLVRDLVSRADIEAAKAKIGEGAIWVYPHAEEASGRNAIPAMMAAHYAAETDGHVGAAIVQRNRAFHTGAGPMERLNNPPKFDGPVTPGGRYAIADDVSTMGGTLSEMANHIQEGGGKVVGVATLANTGRSPTMAPGRHQVSEIERRYGQAVRDIFHVEPSALTRDEATYVLGFKDADALRARVAASARERAERLRAKGLSAQGEVSGDGGPPAAKRSAAGAGDVPQDRAAPAGSASDRTAGAADRGLGLDDEHHAAVQSQVDEIKKDWKNAPDVVIAKNMQDDAIPEAVRAHDQEQKSQGATGEPEGFFYKGKVYLLSDQIHSQADAARVLLHESLGHFGLRGTFGKDLNPILDRVALLNRDSIAAKAEAYGLDPSTIKGRRAAAEEVLAELAQTDPKSSVVRQAIAAIRNWIRENIPGFKDMKLSDDELIRQYLKPAADFVRNGMGEGTAGETRFSRTATPESKAAEEKERFRLPGARLLESATTRLSELIDHGLDETGIFDLVAPMSGGTQRTRAMAQAHINDERKAQYIWQQMDHMIAARYSKAERASMWDAADEENDIRGGKAMPGKGLERLPEDQRAVVEQLSAYGNQLWAMGKAEGLVSGEGVKYWTPRMMAAIDDAGNLSRPTSGEPAASGKGGNIVTSASSMKGRKYETAAETAAAMKAKGGELVRDIRTMPLAMARFERAISGRRLINQIKDLGAATGKELVSTSQKPGFFTMKDNPAFLTSRPHMVEVDGKLTPAVDQNGKVIMDRVPIYISNEFKGPLDAIMTTKENGIYRAYMLLKSKSMSTIMFSPLIHNMVIAGRAFSYAGLKLPALYFTGHVARADTEFMSKMIDKGMVPISGANHSMVDVGDIARGIGKEGSWGDPNESWLALGAKKVGNAIAPGFGTAIKEGKYGLDAAGGVLHGTLLWDRIGDLQAGIARDAYQKAIRKGADDNGAATFAAHMANRYAGAVGRENMSSAARQWANVVEFSRSFNMGNIGAVKDVFYGLPAGLKAQLFEGSSPEKARLVMSMAKRKAFTGLVSDFAATVIVTSLVQDVVNRNKDDDWTKQLADAGMGYVTRAQKAYQNAKDRPTSISSYDPYRLSSTWKNEPGKKDRVDLGAQPNGRHEYMRLPTGKVIEDTLGWMAHPVDTFVKKESPSLKAVSDIVTNNKGFGVPVYDPSSPLPKIAMDMALHLVESQLPMDTIKTAFDLFNGKATDLDKEKLSGNLTGLSISQGHPAGPTGAVEQSVADRVALSRKYVQEAVNRDVKYGDEDRARERLTGIGLTDAEANREIAKARGKLQGQQYPGMTGSKAAAKVSGDMKKFNAHATDEERATMEDVRE